jgi:GAF domain-containing protein
LVDTPIGLLTVTDGDAEVCLACHGPPTDLVAAPQTGLRYSVHHRVLATGRPLVVGDARTDPVLAACRAVTQSRTMACAGMPMMDPAGTAFGVLCVIDVVVREWEGSQLAVLARLAEIAGEVCGERTEDRGEESHRVASTAP